jgi:hypothetical protein
MPNQIKDRISYARQSGTILHLKNIVSDLPSWENFIFNLNYKFNSKKISDWSDSRDLILNNNATEVMIYNKLDLQVRHSVDIGSPNKLFTDDKLIKQMQEYSGFPFGNIKTLINFVANEADYYIHTDDHDVILIQCQGSVEWRIYPSLQSNEYDSYIIEPGDLLFAPKGIVHQAVVFEPRASIVFDHNYG